MSSRSIEGENALYLPQAKIYERSTALGPCLCIHEIPIPLTTKISMTITRDGIIQYSDSTSLDQMKRSFAELTDYLYSECNFPFGSYLMTGTCLVPNNDFTLQEDDTVIIEIDGLGTLINTIAINPRKQV